MTTLRDLLLDSRDGEWGKEELFAGGHQVSVIRGTDFAATRIGATEKIPVRVLDEKHLRRKALQAGDIIIETAGGTKDQPTGRTLYVSDQLLRSLPYPAVCASFARFLRIDPEKALPRFVFWLLQDLYERREILQYHLQHTGVARFQFTTFADSHELVLPDYDTQRRIAGILSAYDDLIEVNQRRIAILEEMARRLFDEWFVRFRYPGHEAVPLVETELGSVPEGWDHGTVSDLSGFISRGISPKYDDGASCLVINQKCIRAQAVNLEPARRQSKPVPAEKFVREGDVLINSTGVGTLGRVAQVLSDLNETTVDSHVTIARAALGVDVSFFGLQLLALQEHFERQGIGATGQTELSKKAIADAALVIPPSGLMRKFGEYAQPIRKQAELLRGQNEQIRAARDLLLPKLISGEIDVGRAEEVLAEAAE